MVRVLVVSGTLGAGKSFTAEAVWDLLVERGERCAVIDLDFLALMHPAPDGDPFNDRLLFANLAAVWPNYRRAAVDFLVLDRVVEDPSLRSRYEAAIPESLVRIVRVEASAETRRDRLLSRMQAGPGRDWHLSRTDSLGIRLRELDADDFTIVNDGARLGRDLAEEILGRLYW